MKLLFISNLYPPNHLGGWEMLAQEVAAQLRARGHHVTVLTSTFGEPCQGEPDVVRQLHLETDVYHYKPRELLRFWSDTRLNEQVLRETYQRVQPDAIVIWGLWNMSRQVAAQAEALAGTRVLYYIAGNWPIEPSAHEKYWDGTANSLGGRVFKGVLRQPIKAALRSEWRPYHLHYEHVMVCSQALRDDLVRGGAPLEQAAIVYHGIEPELYREAARSRQPSPAGALRAVFVGSVLPQKGVHTSVEAIGLLKRGRPELAITLDVLGSGYPEYEQHLRDIVAEYHIEDRVTFHPPIPRTELPRFLARFDALTMPSTWEEPQARISQEAMASGATLVATLTGGTKEILIDEVNGLAFAKEDAAGLAQQLQRLAADPAWREQLNRAAWQTVAERFTITHMIDQFEQQLTSLVAR